MAQNSDSDGLWGIVFIVLISIVAWYAFANKNNANLTRVSAKRFLTH